MKKNPASSKLSQVGIGIIAFLALSNFVSLSEAQQVTMKPVTDVREIMREHARIAETSLWPAFNIMEIPVAVYDSVNTWLFFADQPPEGFNQADYDTGVFVFKGQYPLVWGNSLVRFGETWTATSVLSNYSRRTGERYTPKDLAGIIVHEQFHVFQRTRHPGWRQNDGLLLFYPEETKEALFLRRIEKEAFKRAVLATDGKEITGWVLTALDYRKGRLDMIPAPFGNYERDLQRTEGLSDYIERIARGVDPLNASNMTNGIAPAGVRDLGYWEGRWIAMILDRVSPEWKKLVESNDTLYLEEILESAIKESPFKKQAFGKNEINHLRSVSDKDFDEWQLKKAEEIASYKNLPGYSLEISSISNPLNIRIFEPLEIEILADRAVFHRLIFSAANQKGTMKILNHPCITYFDESFRLVKINIYGLPEAPQVIAEEKKLIVKYRDISLELNYSELEAEGPDLHITI